MTTTNHAVAETEKREKRRRALVAIGAGTAATLALGGAGFAIWSSLGVSRAARLATKGGMGDPRMASGRPRGEAQRPGGGSGGPGGAGFGQRREAMSAQMTQELGLTPDQAKQAKSLGDSMRPQMQALWKNESLSREERFAQMKTLRDQMQTQMRALLTPEQQQKFDAMQAQRQARREQMRERRDQTRAALIASGQTPPERGQRRGPGNRQGR